jgi:hypothetical protein
VGEDGKRFPADEDLHTGLLVGRSPREALESAPLMAALSGLDGTTVEKRIVLETLKKEAVL